MKPRSKTIDKFFPSSVFWSRQTKVINEWIELCGALK